MKRILLWIGGGLNLLFFVFHLTMPGMGGWDIALAGLPAGFRSVIYILNASIAMTLLAFAYLSIFQWKGIASTGVGRAVAICIAAWWLARIGEGVFFDGITGGLVLYAICLVVAALYVAAILLPSGARQASSKPAAASS